MQKGYYIANKEKWEKYYATRKALPHHKEAARSAALRFYYRHKDRLLAANKDRAKAYREKNKERLSKLKSDYVKAHREEHNARGRRWKANNPDKAKEMWKRYKEKYPDQIKLRNKLRRQTHPEKRSEYAHRRRARQMGNTTDKTAVPFFAFVRSKKRIACYYCGKMIPGKSAHIDHIIALAKNGNHASENLCASCAECNQKKSDKLPSQLNFLKQPVFNF